MKNTYRLSIRLYGLLLLMGAMALALSTTATGHTPLADPLALIQPSYNCTTGAITFNTTGGDGSTITYSAPGISRSSLTSNTGTIEQGLRNDPKPIAIQATQSGRTVSYTFDFNAFCGRDFVQLSGVDTTIAIDKAIRIAIGNGSYNPSNPIGNWSKITTGLPPGTVFDYEVRGLSAYVFYIVGTPTTAGTYPVTLTATDPRYPSLPFTSNFTITVTNTTSNPDRAALVDFYNATNGPGWTNKTNWLQGDSPCNWYGVTCDSNGRVYGINLENNNLTGTLPASLGNLSQLRGITLTDNHLSGSIPDSFGNLLQLSTFQVGSNQLSGVIPSSLGNLSELYFFKLNKNLLSGPIPASLKNLSKLYFTDFSDNQLIGPLPSSFGDFRKQQYILLKNNQLSGCIPSNLANYCINGSSVNLSGNLGLPGGGDFASFCRDRTGACITGPEGPVSPALSQVCLLHSPITFVKRGVFSSKPSGAMPLRSRTLPPVLPDLLPTPISL